MAKKETVYDIVFSIYELGYALEKDKNKIRKYLKRHLKKEYGENCDWNKLSAIQRDIFVYITIRQDMLSNYVGSSKCKRINSKIDNILKESFLDSAKDVKQHNSLTEPLFKNYFDESDSDKKEKYKILKNAIQKFNPNVPVPTFEEWLSCPLRPYDYIGTFENEPPELDNDYEYIPSQSEIDHVVLQVLIKIVKEKLDIDINTKLIEECLTFLGNSEVERYETLPDEYDPQIPLSKEKQEKIIKLYRQYYTYKKMLDNLSFTHN